jgi:hypothetical protein
MPRPSHPPWLDGPNNIGETYNLWSFSLCDFLHPPATSSLLCPNILLSTLFSNTVNLCSFLGVRGQCLHPYETKGGFTVLYILWIVVWRTTDRQTDVSHIRNFSNYVKSVNGDARINSNPVLD